MLNLLLLQKKESASDRQQSIIETKYFREEATEKDRIKKAPSESVEVKKVSKLNCVDANVQTDPQLDPLSHWSPVSYPSLQQVNIVLTTI